MFGHRIFRTLIIKTDASLVAVEAVFKQTFSDTSLEHPVAFFSRALTLTEKNYSVYELEMFSVFCDDYHFRVYLNNKKFQLKTDHAALINLLKRDLPLNTLVKNFFLSLLVYTLSIEYQKGSDNTIADVLS